MKLYINTQLNKIVQAVYDDQVFKFDDSTLSPYYTFDVDEVDPINKYLCIDLLKTTGKVDEIGDTKYSVVNGVLLEKEGWVEKQQYVI